MAKPYFFYCTGTAYALALYSRNVGYGLFQTSDPNARIPVPGLNGQQIVWTGGIPNDPFPMMLDPNKWNRVRVNYAAAIFPSPTLSIQSGVNAVVSAISQLPKGTPFALGGYSQGATVMSMVLKNHLQTGSLSSRLGDLKAGVMFGNPSRQTDKLWPGALRSATLDNPGSTSLASGGHGCFPPTYRLSSTPSYWWEFAGGNADPVDIINCVGSGTLGTNWESAATSLLNAGFGALVSLLDGNIFNAVSTVISTFGERGHISYPFTPPPGYPNGSMTSYQFALKYLDDVGAEIAAAPTNIPSPSAGGSGRGFGRGVSNPGWRGSRGTVGSVPRQSPPPRGGRGFR